MQIEIILCSTFAGDFLEPFMRTFYDYSHVLIFVNQYSAVVAQKGPKWSKMVQIGQNHPQKQPKTATTKKKYPDLLVCVILGHFG